MLTVEDQIRLIADAAMEHSQRSVEPRSALRPTGGRLLVTVAAALLVVALLVGLVLRVGNGSHSTPVDQPVSTAQLPVATNVPTVEYPSGQTWFVPATLPAGWVFDRAEDRGDLGQNLRYRSNLAYPSDIQEPAITIDSGNPYPTPTSPNREVDINGVIWKVTDVDASTPLTWWSGTVDGVQLGISSAGVDDTTMRQVLGSLAQQDAASLPRPPIPIGVPTSTAVEVATATQNGSRRQLFVDTDGVSFVFTSDGASGSSVRLGSKEFVVSGAMGPPPSLVSDGQEAESLIWGLVRSDVASIDVELIDGRVVTAHPQDVSGKFIENFFFVAIPTRTEGGLELFSAIVARDRNGVEVGRNTNLFD